MTGFSPPDLEKELSEIDMRELTSQRKSDEPKSTYRFFVWSWMWFVCFMTVLLNASAFAETATDRQCSILFVDQGTRNSLAFARSEFAQRPNDSVEANGLITDQVPLTVENIRYAFRRGIFAWGISESGYGLWHNPPQRGILKFDEIKIGKSDLKDLAAYQKRVDSGELTLKENSAFEKVVRACKEMERYKIDSATNERKRANTWITDEIVRTYTELHHAGYGHTVELWHGDVLVAATYLTIMDGVIAGESMFHNPAYKNSGKYMFYAFIELAKRRGFTWADTQVAAPGSTYLTVKWGAREFPRYQFMRMSNKARQVNRQWTPEDFPVLHK
jgi:leucyl/phenylalanyl-tRNA--protein transferase